LQRADPSWLNLKNLLSVMASREAIKKVTREIFGRADVKYYGQNGHKWMKKELTGVHIARYYPEPIDRIARKVPLCVL